MLLPPRNSVYRTLRGSIPRGVPRGLWLNVSGFRLAQIGLACDALILLCGICLKLLCVVHLVSVPQGFFPVGFVIAVAFAVVLVPIREYVKRREFRDFARRLA